MMTRSNLSLYRSELRKDNKDS